MFTVIIFQVRSFSGMFMVVLTAPLGLAGAVPTLLLFQNGEVVDRIVGAVPKGTVENSLKKVLG